MKLMVFLHGTVIMHKNALGRSREERVQQVLDRDESLRLPDLCSSRQCSEKAAMLETTGSGDPLFEFHQNDEDVEQDKIVLRNHNFPASPVFFRQRSEGYNDIAERVLPDILIEDDCESIGGKKEMTYPHINPKLKERMKSIVVKEFGGIDHLPDDISALMNY